MTSDFNNQSLTNRFCLTFAIKESILIIKEEACQEKVCVDRSLRYDELSHLDK
jgi:hypothetical protein